MLTERDSEVAKITVALRQTSITSSLTLIDDGNFFIEHNGNFDFASGNGVLRRREPGMPGKTGVLAQCGSYKQNPDGSWESQLATPEGPRKLGRFADRFEAIAMLWVSRTLL